MALQTHESGTSFLPDAQGMPWHYGVASSSEDDKESDRLMHSEAIIGWKESRINPKCGI